jgi:hypothetical protein
MTDAVIAITELQSRMIAQASANAFAFARLEDNLERCKSSINGERT